jgi:hypothetical protein
MNLSVENADGLQGWRFVSLDRDTRIQLSSDHFFTFEDLIWFENLVRSNSISFSCSHPLEVQQIVEQVLMR